MRSSPNNLECLVRHWSRLKKSCPPAFLRTATMSASDCIEYSFQLPSSDQVVRYTLRGLGEDEIDSWSRFCEQVFSYKKPQPPPASYFARHYDNDPHRDSALVRVATIFDDDADDEHIVASCRVFHRTIASPLIGQQDDETSGTAVIDAGGIGEVCTAADHRRRGLSNQLLQQAIAAMSGHDDSSSAPSTLTTSRNMKLSFLHSAPTFFPVYQKAGYTSTRSRWSVITISIVNASADDSRNKVRAARFPEDTVSLQALHRQYSESRFVGCIIRSEAYWNDYLSKELEDSLFVVTGEDDSSTILGWMSVRFRNDRYQLREFGCTSRATVPRVFLPLLKHALQHGLHTSMPDTVRLHLPTSVLEDVSSQGPMAWFSQEEQEDDWGWMYKDLEDSEKEIQFNTEKDHLIWPSDSF
jgi:GNAT superfamily N-acetyltransferase